MIPRTLATPRRPLDVVGEDRREAPAFRPVRDHRHPLPAMLVQRGPQLGTPAFDQQRLDRPARELDVHLALRVHAPHRDLQATRQQRLDGVVSPQRERAPGAFPSVALLEVVAVWGSTSQPNQRWARASPVPVGASRGQGSPAGRPAPRVPVLAGPGAPAQPLRRPRCGSRVPAPARRGSPALRATP